jgi:hypothetical protein
LPLSFLKLTPQVSAADGRVPHRPADIEGAVYFDPIVSRTSALFVAKVVKLPAADVVEN